MPDGTHNARRRDTLLRLPVGDLRAWHLIASCHGCRQHRIVPLAPLVARFGENATLAELLPRLRCRSPTCKRPPATIRLRNRTDERAPGPVLIDVVIKSPERPAW